MARDAGNWSFTHRLAEHWLVKPVSLALIAFPVTGLLAWGIHRLRFRAVGYAAGWLLMGGWYVLLTGLFLP
mgnify:CR=1 FL=1